MSTTLIWVTKTRTLNPMLCDLDSARVQRLRVARGLTQRDLAHQLAVPTATLSRILSGHIALDQDNIDKLATALGCDPRLLSRPPEDLLYTRPWLRAYADAPKKTVEQFVADTLLAVESFNALRLKRVPERLPVFAGDPNDHHEIDEFAISVREAADIVDGAHVPNVTRAAERLGCIVLPMDHELGKHLGMSMIVDGIPVIRVARTSANVPGDRQRFTLAHELGHLTLHQSCAPPEAADQAKSVEQQAHRFAGAFLLPAEQFLTDLDEVGGKVTLTTLSKLKARWGVAIKAMVVRLQQLHRIDSDHARSLYKQISARGWNKGEPVEVQPEQAIWLTKALARRFPENTVTRASDAVGLDPDHLSSWLDWEPIPIEPASILQFPVRNGQTGARL